nr:hypothetical protein [Ilumatobacter nonamiensis]
MGGSELIRGIEQSPFVLAEDIGMDWDRRAGWHRPVLGVLMEYGQHAAERA